MELDLQSLLGSCVQLYSLAETPQLPPPPEFGLIYEGAIGQPRETTSLCNPLLLTILVERKDKGEPLCRIFIFPQKIVKHVMMGAGGGLIQGIN
jgi:hypothetical protein